MNKLFALGFVSLFFAVVGCSSDAANAITNPIDCHHVCQRYADCYNSSYDVDGCASKCADKANDSNNNQDHLDACNGCIGDKSCLNATFSCASDCSGIVP